MSGRVKYRYRQYFLSCLSMYLIISSLSGLSATRFIETRPSEQTDYNQGNDEGKDTAAATILNAPNPITALLNVVLNLFEYAMPASVSSN